MRDACGKSSDGRETLGSEDFFFERLPFAEALDHVVERGAELRDFILARRAP